MLSTVNSQTDSLLVNIEEDVAVLLPPLSKDDGLWYLGDALVVIVKPSVLLGVVNIRYIVTWKDRIRYGVSYKGYFH